MCTAWHEHKPEIAGLEVPDVIKNKSLHKAQRSLLGSEWAFYTPVSLVDFSDFYWLISKGATLR